MGLARVVMGVSGVVCLVLFELLCRVRIWFIDVCGVFG